MKTLLRLPLYPPVWFLGHIALAVALQRWTESPVDLPGHRLLGSVIGFAGVAFTVLAMVTVHRGQTPILPYRRPEHLLTRGPFRLSRNPIYLGEAIILVGLALRTGELLPWITVPLFIGGLTLGPVRWEENALRDRFGAAFSGYCHRTRRWL